MINKIITFLKEVKVELKKVNWPTTPETIRYTLIVLGVSVAIAIYLGGLDYILDSLMKKFIIQ